MTLKYRFSNLNIPQKSFLDKKKVMILLQLKPEQLIMHYSLLGVYLCVSVWELLNVRSTRAYTHIQHLRFELSRLSLPMCPTRTRIPSTPLSPPSVMRKCSTRSQKCLWRNSHKPVTKAFSVQDGRLASCLPSWGGKSELTPHKETCWKFHEQQGRFFPVWRSTSLVRANKEHWERTD